LRDQRIGHRLDRAVDDQHVVRRRGRMAGLERAFDDGDVGDAGKCSARRCRQRRLAFERDDRIHQVRQHRRGIAARRADEQHTVARAQFGLGQQPPGRDRQILRAAVTERHGGIAIRDRLRIGGQERLARDAVHRRHHARVAHRIGAQLARHHCVAHRHHFGILRHHCHRATPLSETSFAQLS
jgi:hypothetical protein